MGTYRDRYIEMHSLEFDYMNSDCYYCEYSRKQGCQYYYGKCPNQKGGE